MNSGDKIQPTAELQTPNGPAPEKDEEEEVIETSPTAEVQTCLITR